MAMQEADPASPPTAEFVGSSFVSFYYHTLQQTSNIVHKVYQESSFLSRLDSNGRVTTVTTLKAINEKIMSQNFNEYDAEIITIDAQDSYENSVLVALTGCLYGKDGIVKKFTQSFFLAPQENGYYVQNDIFRFLDESDTLDDDDVLQNAVTEHYEATEVETVTDITTAPAPHKMTDSEIVKNMENVAISGPGRVSACNVNVASSQQLPTAAVVSPPVASAPSVGSASGSRNVPEEVEVFSIYVRNLPINVTPEQLEAVFKKFGPIKHEGIHVRGNESNCYGFVEFEELSSRQSALKASPVKIGDRLSFIEVTRSTNQGRGNAGGRYTSGRSRGRGSGGRGSSRNSFKN